MSREEQLAKEAGGIEEEKEAENIGAGKTLEETEKTAPKEPVKTAPVLLFAGTREGEEMAAFLLSLGIPVQACTATEYGAALLPEGVIPRPGRLSEGEMEELLKKEIFSLVIDATHPYAREVSENIKAACRQAHLPCLRVLRPRREPSLEQSTQGSGRDGKGGGGVIYVRDIPEAVSFLSGTEGNILLTTGSKDLAAFASLPGFAERVYARVLSLPSSVEEAARLGLNGRHLIAMQGPFSREMNEAMLRMFDCRYLVTKDTGKAGGFPEKTEAALACRALCLVIGRPREEEEGMPLSQARAFLVDFFRCRPERTVVLLGMGMGGEDTLTCEGKRALSGADLIIGSKRLLKELAGQQGLSLEAEPEFLEEVRPAAIASYLASHPEYLSPVLVFSGDVGFYSGAVSLAGKLQEAGERVRLLPGVSSVSAFFAKAGESWEDALLLSAHGKHPALGSHIARNRKVFALLGTAEDVARVSRTLCDFSLGDVVLHVGENLSSPEERILSGPARDFVDHKGTALSVLLAVNERAKPLPATHGLPDEAFVRGKAPMTKWVVRAAALAKLSPSPESICYDVGAGTGSVSCELALRCPYGRVYAIEYREEALALLEENRRRFCLDNLYPVAGRAPEALQDLSAPDVAFVGGSGGELSAIVQVLLQKNPAVRLAVVCVTLETLAEAVSLLTAYPWESKEVVSVSAAQARELGAYHLMQGENPVTILVLAGKRASEVDRKAETDI